MFDKVLEAIARIGWHGAAGALLIGTFCGLVAYGFVVQPDVGGTKELIGALVLLVGAGGKAGLDAFGGRGNGAR